MSYGSPTIRTGKRDPTRRKKAMLMLHPPKKSNSSGNVLRSEEHVTTWRPLKWRPAPEQLILLEATGGGAWTFQNPRNDRLYRCEIDPSGSERWFFKAIPTESEWISQSDAARLLGVSRQAITCAIVYKRLRTVDCNGRPMVRRAEVLALKINPKLRRARKQSRSNDQT